MECKEAEQRLRWSEIHQSYLLFLGTSLNCCDAHTDYLPKEQKSTLANSSHWCLERRVVQLVQLEHSPTPSTLEGREGHPPSPSHHPVQVI